MKRYIWLILAIACLAVWAVAPSQAQTQSDADRTWWAEYYNNATLTGESVLAQHESAIAFEWLFGSPDYETVNTDFFSARFSRVLTVDEATTYRMTLMADDGARVYVDDELIFDRWSTPPRQPISAEMQLAAGDHRIRVEYYENVGGAMLRFDMAPVLGINTETWVGQYFNSNDTFGYPDASRRTREINFDWGYGSPDPRINDDYWGARWTRLIDVEERATYRFLVSADDGIRIFVDDELLIDGWKEQPWRTLSADILLGVGQHTVRVEYYENVGYAYINVDFYVLRSNDNREESGPIEVISYIGPFAASQQGVIEQVPDNFYGLSVDQAVPGGLYRSELSTTDSRYIYRSYVEWRGSRLIRGIQIVDTWNKHTVIGYYPMQADQRVTGLAVRGGYLYISWTYEGQGVINRSCDGAVDIVNVQDTSNVDEVGQIIGQGYPHSVYVYDRVLYVLWACTTGLAEDYNSRIDFYDLSPTEPNWLTSDHLPRGTEYIPWQMPMAAYGGNLYVPYDRDKWIIYGLP